MSRRGENIYKRKDNRWEGRFIKSRREDGRISYGYVYAASYKETKDKLLLKKFEYRKYQQKEANQYFPSSVAAWSDQCLELWEEQIKSSTYSTYKYKLAKYILPYIGSRRLIDVRRSHIKQLIQQWKKMKLSIRMIHLLFQLVRRLFGVAWKKNLIPRDPCIEIVLPKQEIKKITPLSVSEQHQLEDVARKEKNGEAILIALRLGLRIGEIAALKWENIDFDKKLLHIKETYQRLTMPTITNALTLGPAKTISSNRILPLTEEMIKILNKMRENNHSDFVFHVREKPMEPRLITYHFHRIREKAKLKDIHFHQLRHTFATRLLESKVTIASISELLGHRSTQMTLDIYTGTVFEEKYSSLRMMEQAI